MIILIFSSDVLAAAARANSCPFVSFSSIFQSISTAGIVLPSGTLHSFIPHSQLFVSTPPVPKMQTLPTSSYSHSAVSKAQRHAGQAHYFLPIVSAFAF